LLSHPEVKSTARRTGRAELDEHAQGVNAAELDARFELNGKHKEEFFDELRRSLSVIPGTNITIGQPIGHRIDHMLSGTRANIAVKIYGPDLYRLRSFAESVRTQMEGISGVVDLAVEQQVDVPQVRIKVNRRAMATYGVTVGELAEAIDVAFNGEVASQVLEGQQSYDLVVRFNEQNRGNIERIRNGILMIEHYHHLLAEGKSFRDAIVQGSLERLNPILMTALAAGLGLIPLALGGEPGKEIQTPMAIVILGGLLSSTALNMIVVPSLFYKFGKENPNKQI
jgi:Cu/Ag efflux pump CusA